VTLCTKVLGRPEFATDPRFATSPARTANRAATDGMVAEHFARHGVDELAHQLEAAQIAFARVNDVHAILRHPHLRRLSVASPNGPVQLPAPSARVVGEAAPEFGPLPALGEHTNKVRTEFLGP
jgi:crotonobetainyl-CoA:carnitine CoA-transferase CaiB-like acyl-CoA transferase